MATNQRTLRLPTELDQLITRHCASTNRDEPATLRAIVRLFYADGLDVAERRLSADMWDAPAQSRRLSDDDVTEIVTGRRPSEKRRGKSA